jgi:rhamnosyl/mannosyltransferase
MAAALRAARPDLVHIHLPHPAGVLGLLGSGYRGPLVATYHSDVVRQRFMSLAFHPFLAALLRRTSTIVVTSPNYLATSPVLRPHRPRCRIVPYGISTERFSSVSSDETSAITGRFGRPLVLAVGRLVYYKGFEVLIDAMTSAPGHLVIIGDGPLDAALRERVRARGLDRRVTFVGEVQNTHAAPYFAAADVFVLPSVARSEAFGIVQLEAMASGTPVINTTLDSGVPWVSRDGVTGFTVRPEDPSTLARAIERIVADADLRARFSRAARQRVEVDFTLERMGNRLAAIYDAALSRRSAPEDLSIPC